MRRVCAQLALAVACASLAWGQAAEPPTRPVGVRGVVRGVVGPAELRPRHPASGRPPLVVRVLGAAPHGSAFR
ncbi:MAG: hypothetical protein KDD82_26905, partial [Planctomycetes bacterium]|nr:hypothetical protein [Planctomycetota bacterium]